MAGKLNFRDKNYILLAGTLILFLLSWNLAWKKTYEAISLSRRLQRQAEGQNNLASNPAYTAKKNLALSRLTSRYSQTEEEWKNNFWLTVSGMTVYKNVSINYTPAETEQLTDSASIILRQSITFEGAYKNLVSLVDTLEKTPGAGIITSLDFLREKKNNAEPSEMLKMKVVFSAISKKK